SGGGLSLTGIDSTGCIDGTIKVIQMGGWTGLCGDLQVTHEDAASLAANRINLPNGSTGIVATMKGALSGRLGDSAILRYDGQKQRWAFIAKAFPMPHGSSHVDGTDDVPGALGCTNGAAGQTGLIPAPAASMQEYVLYGRAIGGAGGPIDWQVSGMVSRVPRLSFTLQASVGMYFPSFLELGSGIDVDIPATSFVEIG